MCFNFQFSGIVSSEVELKIYVITTGTKKHLSVTIKKRNKA